MDEGTAATPPVQLDEVDVGHGGPGVVWSAEPSQLNVNLVVLPPGASIATHTNREVDVLVVTVAGAGRIDIDGRVHELIPPSAVVVPLGAERAVVAGPDGIRYLSVHRARAPLAVRPGSSARPPG